MLKPMLNAQRSLQIPHNSILTINSILLPYSEYASVYLLVIVSEMLMIEFSLAGAIMDYEFSINFW